MSPAQLTLPLGKGGELVELLCTDIGLLLQKQR